VYENCPTANRAIYTYGEKILEWKIANEQDATKKQAFIDKAIELYDKWVKYKADATYPKGRILGRKACTYINYNEGTKIVAYNWLKESVTTQGEKSELNALQQFVIVSYEKYKADASFAEQFINDYLTVSEIADAKAKNPEEKNKAAYATVKTNSDALFLASGVADCATLDNIFKLKVEENSTNVDYLNTILSCYRRLRCNESSVFFKASEFAHKISPTAESANGCAEMSYKNEKYDEAIAYYEEAVKLATDVLQKSDYQFKMAQICSKLNRYSKAREYARLALSNNPNDGRPYLLIGSLYAQSKIYDDATLQKTVYWVAVDKFEQAKRVDPENCTEDANRMISTYKKYYPSKEEVFMHPDLQHGKTFRVEGWIGESTVCR
jgi:tetratricopeptide (TPR) repeat protein